MRKQLVYTGIGSRKTPKDIQHVMANLAEQLGQHHWILRSGHADGADMAFEIGSKNYDKEIYLPWPGFNGAGRKPYYIVKAYDELVARYAESFHPNWEACSNGVKLLHMRNAYQICGSMGDWATDMVICWTPNGDRSGGTGQALRYAEHLNIPIFDLGLPDLDGTLSALEQYTNKLMGE